MHYVAIFSFMLDNSGEFKKGKFSQRVWIQINENLKRIPPGKEDFKEPLRKD
ncbi:hypothetical protein N8079_03070 [Crocinitomicaceae bacterium]|nr:hypothetical protein [Crocinitomicaceae bacterium]